MADNRVELEIRAVTDKAIADIKKLQAEAGRSLDQATKSAQGFQSSLTNIGRTATSSLGGIAKTIGAAAAGFAAFQIGRNAVDGLIKFETALSEVKTIADEAIFPVEELQDQALALSSEFGGSAASQVQSFYQAISAGASSAADATETVTAANKLAVGGLTDVSTSIQALTTVTNIYGRDVLNAGQASDVLFSAIRDGKTTAEELTPVIGTLSVAGQSIGLGFAESTGALAAFTTVSGSTAEAATGLRALFTALQRAQGRLAKQSPAVQKAFDVNTIATRGLAQSIQDMQEAVGGSSTELLNILGRTEAVTAVNSLYSVGNEKLTQTINNAKRAQTDFADESKQAADIINNTISKQLDILTTNFENIILGVSIEGAEPGVELLKALNSGLQSVAEVSREFREEIILVVKGVAGLGSAFAAVAGANFLKNQVSTLLTFTGLLREGSKSAALLNSSIGQIVTTPLKAVGAELTKAFFAFQAGGLSAGIASIKGSLASLIPIVKTLGTTLKTAFIPLTIVSGTVFAVNELRKAFTGLADEVGGIGNALGVVLLGIKADILGLLADIPLIGDQFSEAAQTAKDDLDSLIDEVADVAEVNVDAILGGSPLKDQVEKATEEAGDAKVTVVFDESKIPAEIKALQDQLKNIGLTELEVALQTRLERELQVENALQAGTINQDISGPLLDKINQDFQSTLESIAAKSEEASGKFNALAADLDKANLSAEEIARADIAGGLDETIAKIKELGAEAGASQEDIQAAIVNATEASNRELIALEGELAEKRKQGLTEALGIATQVINGISGLGDVAGQNQEFDDRAAQLELDLANEIAELDRERLEIQRSITDSAAGQEALALEEERLRIQERINEAQANIELSQQTGDGELFQQSLAELNSLKEEQDAVNQRIRDSVAQLGAGGAEAVEAVQSANDQILRAQQNNAIETQKLNEDIAAAEQARIQSVASTVTGIASPFLDTIVPGLGGATSALVGLFAQGGEQAKAQIQGFVDAIPDLFATIAEALPDVLLGIIDSVLSEDFISRLIENAPKFIEGIVAALPQLIDAIVANLPTITFALVEGIITNLVPAMAQITLGLLRVAVELPGKLIGGAVSFVARLIGQIPQFIGQFASALGRIVSDVFQSLLDLPGRLVSGILDGLRDGVASVFDGLNPFSSEEGDGGVIDTVTSGFKKAGKAVGDFFGFNEGGIVPGGGPNRDSVTAALTPGELVIPRDDVGMLRDFLQREQSGDTSSEEGGSKTIIVQLQVGQEQLAETLVEINRAGLRTA